MQPHVEEIYMREIAMQCNYALAGVAQMNELLKTEMVEAFFRETQAFLSHAAAVSRILWPPRAKDQRAKARGEYLRSVLDIADGHALQKRTLSPGPQATLRSVRIGAGTSTNPVGKPRRSASAWL